MDGPTYPIWDALADAKRRQIVQLLSEKPRTTSELSAFFDVTRFAVMKHLKVLEEAGLVLVRREGRKRWNFLNQTRLASFERRERDQSGATQPVMDEIEAWLARESQPAPAVVAEEISLVCELPPPPPVVFAAWTTEIDAWWPHRQRPDSRVLLEPAVNGRFWEKFDAAGNGALYGVVTYLQRDQELHFRGPFLLAEQATSCYVRLHLATAGQTGSRLSVWHHLVSNDGVAARAYYEDFWQALVNDSLRPYLETNAVRPSEPAR